MKAHVALVAALLACQQVNARPDGSPPPAANPIPSAVQRDILAATAPAGVLLRGETASVELVLESQAEAAIAAALAAGGRRLVLAIEGVEFSEQPDLHYELYLGLPAGAQASAESAHFVGNLPFYALAGVTGRAHDYDVTAIVRRLRAAGTWGVPLVVTFVPGRPGAAQPTPPVRIARLTLSAES